MKDQVDSIVDRVIEGEMEWQILAEFIVVTVF